MLALLLVAVWRHRTVQQQNLAIQELDTEEYSEKIVYHSESEGIPDAANSNQLVPLRPHPHRHKHTFCREEVVASVRMSLCHSHLIGPEDEVFHQFMIDRLAEADQDPCVPPFDCLHTYAYEGSGSLAASLSSLESSNFDPYFDRSNDTGPGFLRLSRWQGANDYESSF